MFPLGCLDVMMDAGQRRRGRGVSEGCDGSRPAEDGGGASHSISSSVRLCALTMRCGGNKTKHVTVISADVANI